MPVGRMSCPPYLSLKVCLRHVSEVYRKQEVKNTVKTRLTAVTLMGAIPAILVPVLMAQSSSSETKKQEKKYQAKPPKTQPFGAEAFGASDKTTIRWTGNGGFFLHNRGTTLMVDPLLEGFDMPLLIDYPIKPKDVPHLDAALVTHSDNDHYSVPTCRGLSSVCHVYHSTMYVASLMKKDCHPLDTVSGISLLLALYESN